MRSNQQSDPHPPFTYETSFVKYWIRPEDPDKMPSTLLGVSIIQKVKHACTAIQ